MSDQETTETTNIIPDDVVSAMNYAREHFGHQFKVKCHACGDIKAVRLDVFNERIVKVYKAGHNLKDLVEKYHCAKCRKEGNVDLLGNDKPKGGSGKIIASM